MGPKDLDQVLIESGADQKCAVRVAQFILNNPKLREKEVPESLLEMLLTSSRQLSQCHPPHVKGAFRLKMQIEALMPPLEKYLDAKKVDSTAG
jgi:hypothetical protein